MTAALLLLALAGQPGDLYDEPPDRGPDATQCARVRDAWRAAGLEVSEQVRTPNGARCDLTAGGWACEVELAPLWDEGVGQALNYGGDLGLRPALVLVAGPGDGRFVRRARQACETGGVLLLVIGAEGEVPPPPKPKPCPCGGKPE